MPGVLTQPVDAGAVETVPDIGEPVYYRGADGSCRSLPDTLRGLLPYSIRHRSEAERAIGLILARMVTLFDPLDTRSVEKKRGSGYRRVYQGGNVWEVYQPSKRHDSRRVDLGAGICVGCPSFRENYQKFGKGFCKHLLALSLFLVEQMGEERFVETFRSARKEREDGGLGERCAHAEDTGGHREPERALAGR